MSKEVKAKGGAHMQIVREAGMPAYRYQTWGGGSGSLSTKEEAGRATKREALRALNLGG
jgi:hypothetical protein